MRTGSYVRERQVVDVATEEQCPARNPGLPHDIQAAHTRRGRPSGDPTWRCIHCHETWADLDQKANRDLRRRPK